jgi:hypothetical protein
VTATAIGPSGGETGRADRQQFDADLYEKHPDLTRRLATIGRHPRAGHDRARWESVRWEDYRAHVGIQQRRGPWSVEMVQCRDDGLDAWVAGAEKMPHAPGWYTALMHDERGLVMSDLPAEIAGCLPFLDAARTAGEQWSQRVLVTGLGLGIVPAWLLHNTGLRRLDVVEIDAGIIELVTRDGAARDYWAADPRLHVHHADALAWPARGNGCALHDRCPEPPCWTAAWHDIWDTVSPGNLPSMHRLHRRFGRWCDWQMSWERPECEAMRRRGQTVEHPGYRCLEDSHSAEAT